MALAAVFIAACVTFAVVALYSLANTIAAVLAEPSPPPVDAASPTVGPSARADRGATS